jgi:hypothetical protein
MLAAMTGVSFAGTGPWALEEGDQTIYLGTEAQRLSRLSTSDGSFSDSVLDVDSGISTFGLKAVGTFGLLPGMEIEASLPWYTSRLNREDGPVCALLGGDVCRPTSGVGVVGLRAKQVVLDEVLGPPLTFTVGLETRFGHLTTKTRDRLTNLGEGTFDVGPLMWVGRSAGLGGGGYWSAYVETGYRFRQSTSQVRGTGVPAHEWHGQTELQLAPKTKLSFGPMVSWLVRPGGVDFEEANPANPDWLAGLAVTKISAGGTVIARGEHNVTGSLSVLNNVWTVNNPTDVLSVNLGLSIQEPLKRGRD